MTVTVPVLAALSGNRVEVPYLFCRTANDAPSLQGAITRDIATQLRPRLAGGERDNLATVGTMDAESYQLYLKGLYHFDGYVPENLKMASDYFEKATAKDPAYAAAYAGLSEASAARVFRICWRVLARKQWRKLDPLQIGLCSLMTVLPSPMLL